VSKPAERELVRRLGQGDGDALRPNWHQDIAPLVYENCVGCHYEGGIGPFALSKQLGTSVQEAKTFIDSYFERLPDRHPREDGLPEASDRFYQGSIGTHGVHILFIADSDNARQTVPLTEIVSEQRMVMLPGDPGNVGAIVQSSLKRMLAWSSVAQAGYLLAGVVVGTRLGLKATAFYLAVYLLMNVAAFAVVVDVTEGRRAERELEEITHRQVGHVDEILKGVEDFAPDGSVKLGFRTRRNRELDPLRSLFSPD
jgi:hypothetical protein